MWDFSKGYRIFSPKSGTFAVLAYFKNTWGICGWKRLHLTQNLIAYGVTFEVDVKTKKRFSKYKVLHAFALAKKIELVDVSDLESIDTSDYREVTYIPKKFHHFVDTETEEPVLKSSSIIMSMGKIKYK